MARVEHMSDDVVLHLGDCREILPGIDPVGSVITDPPYESQAHAAKINKGVKLDFKAIDDELRAFIPAWAAENCEGWLLAFCQVEAVAAWRDAIEKAKLRYKRGLAWVKPDALPQMNGQGPATGFECLTAAWCPGGFSQWNAGGKRGVYTHNTNGPNRHGVHPTEKPVSLMVELIADFAPADSVVLDPFMGSGTTGVAAVREGRGFVGIELDVRYFEIACQRIRDELRRPRLKLSPMAKPVQAVLDLGAA
ncbi:MAG: hypothetical protein B7Z40_20945 [Bosea sp. 12-68-7]|nr:MAG: hypothetical protein B7Z40_20945 [Bosea sp. 12-68-7]